MFEFVKSFSWFASFCFYLVTFGICFLINKIVFENDSVKQKIRRLLPLSPQSQQYFLSDLLFTFQVCLFSLENGNMLGNYGYPGHMFTLFCLGLCLPSFSRNCYQPGTVSDPCSQADRLFKRHIKLKDTVILVVSQFFVAMLAVKVAGFWWSYAPTRFHFHRYHAVCTTDLTVSARLGVLIELIGAVLFATSDILAFFVIHYINVYARKLSTIRQVQGYLIYVPYLHTVITSALDVFIVYSGIFFTGMYGNPALAAANTFGCGDPYLTHFIIYWIGPFLGTFFVHILELRQLLEKALPKSL